MDLILLLAQAKDAVDATGSGIDWAGVSMAITAAGGIIVAILQAMGKSKASEKAQHATDVAKATIHGIEQAEKGDVKDLTTIFNAATGLDLSEEHVKSMQKAYSKAVKTSVKKTSMERNLESYLSDLVKKTTRLSKEELKKKLDAPN